MTITPYSGNPKHGAEMDRKDATGLRRWAFHFWSQSSQLPARDSLGQELVFSCV